jgi:uncharacterized membrane protein
MVVTQDVFTHVVRVTLAISLHKFHLQLAVNLFHHFFVLGSGSFNKGAWQFLAISEVMHQVIIARVSIKVSQSSRRVKWLLEV